MIFIAKTFVCLSIQLLFLETQRAVGEYDDILCGFPGIPAHGEIGKNKSYYEVDEIVTYKCKSEYEMKGENTTKCTKEGIWKTELPLCKKNLAYHKTAIQTDKENNLEASNAVDGWKKTCAETTNTWMVELDDLYVIETIELTVIVESVSNLSISVSSDRKTKNNFKHISVIGETMIDSEYTCENSTNSNCSNKEKFIEISGEPHTAKFKICEVKVYEMKEYECGEPDFEPNCTVKIKIENDRHIAYYKPQEGYKIVKGSGKRKCTNGKWEDKSPLCAKVSSSQSGKMKGLIAGLISSVLFILLIAIVIILIKVLKKLQRKPPINPLVQSMGTTCPHIYSTPYMDPSTFSFYDNYNSDAMTLNRSILLRNPMMKEKYYDEQHTSLNRQNRGQATNENLCDDEV